MDLQHLNRLNGFLLAATASAWQHKISASLTCTGMVGWGRGESFSKRRKGM